MGSRLVDIGYSDPSPQRAQRIANAYADAFVASNLDKRFQANASAKTFLEDKIQQLKLRLEESEKKLLDFAQDQQIVDVNDKASIAENNLATANAALGNLIAERTKNEQLWHQVEAGEDHQSCRSFCPTQSIDALRAKRKDSTSNISRSSRPSNPTIPRWCKSRTRSMRSTDNSPTRFKQSRILLKGAYEASLAQENEMQKRIETLKAGRSRSAKAQHPVQHPEARGGHQPRALYSLLQRYKEVDVASGVGANNVFVVDRAGVPGGPSSPDFFARC